MGRVYRRISLTVAGLTLSSWQVVAGLDYVAIGMILFALAVLTSLVKGGVLPWWSGPGRGKVPDTFGPLAVEGAATGEPIPH